MKKEEGITMNMLRLCAAAGLTLATSAASAQTVVATGLDDFSIHTVGEGLGGFFPDPVRNNATLGRFQVNSSNPDPSNRTFGLWTVFNVGTDTLLNGAGILGMNVELFGAEEITTANVDPVITGGTFEVYLSTDQADVLDASNGFDWIDSDPAGLGNQFSNLFFAGSVDLVEGDLDSVSIDLDIAAAASALNAASAAGDQIRVIITSSTPGAAASFGVGVPSASTSFFQFDGAAPTVSFVIPTPAGVAAFAAAGLFAGRRRRA